MHIQARYDLDVAKDKRLAEIRRALEPRTERAKRLLRNPTYSSRCCRRSRHACHGAAGGASPLSTPAKARLLRHLRNLRSESRLDAESFSLHSPGTEKAFRRSHMGCQGRLDRNSSGSHGEEEDRYG